MSVTVYGASDDLIEVEGDVEEEFSANSEGSDFLAFSNGTVIEVDFTKSGVWRIHARNWVPATVSVIAAPEDDESNYSDVLTIDEDIRWVVRGKDFVMRQVASVRG